jgi:hypothetical protein
MLFLAGSQQAAKVPRVLPQPDPETADPVADARKKGRLGWISSEMESRRDGVGAVSSGEGDRGGVSYGSSQLSSRMGTMADFLKNEGKDFAAEFEGLKFGSPDFGMRYKELASKEGEALEDAQHNYIYRTHYRPAEAYAEKLGFDMTDRALQEAVWSMSVQHSPKGWQQILDDVADSGALEGPNPDLIKSIYDLRGKYGRKHASAAATDGRYKGEVESVLGFDEQLRSDPWRRVLTYPGASSERGTATDAHLEAVRRLQWAFDKGASAEQLQKLSRELNLEFNKGDIGELLAAIKYRDAGGRGTRFVEEIPDR